MFKLHTLLRGMFIGVILSTVVVCLLQWIYRNEAVSDANAAGVITTSRGAYLCPLIYMFHAHEINPYSVPVPASLEPMRVVPVRELPDGAAWI
jgi:hypothetical protein